MSVKVFSKLDPGAYDRHPLHDLERDWPETNCYLDIWIEVLHVLGLPPEACLGSLITQDFEGDQFTFFKVPLEDLESLFGLRVTELAIYDRVESHILEQIRRGRLSLVEMDSFFLPDTQGVGYHEAHGKTTIAVNMIDFENRTMDYFHGLGLHRLEGEDFDGVFCRNVSAGSLPFLPYTEFVKFPAGYPDEDHIRTTAAELLQKHLEKRPPVNPLRSFAKVFPDQAAAVAQRPFDFFHRYAFNTLRQLGANFELFSAHLSWLSDGSGSDLENAATHAKRISEVCKSLQFQLARAVTRKKFDKLTTALDPAAEAWDDMVALIAAHTGTSSNKAA